MSKKQTNGNLALEQQRVIVIPAHDEIVARKLRVAAYARVSSASEDQLNSYRVQNQYYSELISGNPDWEMVDIYAEMYNRILIQCPPHGSVEKWLKQRLSADLNRLPKAFFFVS